MKRRMQGLFVLLSALTVLSFGSCAQGSDPDYPLSGTWTLTTTSTLGDDFGDGSFSLTFITSVDMMGIDLNMYTGTLTLSGGDYDGTYDVEAADWTDGELTGEIYFTDDLDGDGTDESFDLIGAISGGTVTGDYYIELSDTSSEHVGTFTAIK